MRQVLQRGHWYFFQEKREALFYVLENKVLAGRAERAAGEAVGRKLTVAFFERLGNEGLVRPVDRSSQALKQQLLTLAELLQTCGLGDLAHDPSRTSAETELLLEAKYLDLELRRHKGLPEPTAQDPNSFLLEADDNAEETLLEDLQPEDLTKLAFARTLQRHDRLGSRETLKEAWATKWEALRRRVDTLLPHPPAPPAPAAPARGARAAPGPQAGRGRGRGRGRVAGAR